MRTDHENIVGVCCEPKMWYIFLRYWQQACSTDFPYQLLITSLCWTRHGVELYFQYYPIRLLDLGIGYHDQSSLLSYLDLN